MKLTVHHGLLPHAMHSPEDARLSQREFDTVVLIACGLSCREIADRIGGVSYKTIDTHRGNGMGKIGARTSQDLVLWALQWGLINLDGTPVEAIEPGSP